MAYAAKTDIEAIFGDNVTKWANINNDDNVTTIANRIAAAIVAATADFDDRIRGGHFMLPITGHDGSTTPAKVTDIVATLAGVWLSDNRGTEDQSPGRGQSRMVAYRTWAYKQIEMILSGEIRLYAL